MAFQARPGGILGEGRGAGGGHDVSCLPCEFKGAGWHNCPVLGTPASAVAAGGAGPSGARAHGGGHGAECPRASAPSSPPQPGPSAACRTSQVMTLGDSVGRTHLGGRRWLSSPPEACTASSALGPPFPRSHCAQARQGGCTWEDPGESGHALLPQSPGLLLSPTPDCAVRGFLGSSPPSVLSQGMEGSPWPAWAQP